MTWIITKKNDFLYMVTDAGMNKGMITVVPAIADNKIPKFKVEMLMINELTRTFINREEAVGYIRGIEATVNLYAKETGRTKKHT